MKRGLLLVLATAIISGVSIFMNSFAVKGFDSSVFTFSKNVLVAFLLGAVLLGLSQFKELKKITKQQWSKLIVIGFIGGSLPFLLFFKGLQMTTGSMSSFIHKSMIFLVVILAVLYLKEKISKSLIAGSVLILGGNYLFLRPDLALTQGHLLIITATALWAVEQIISKHVLRDISGTVVAFSRMFFGSIFILIYLIFTQKTSLILTMSLEQYMWIGVTSLFLFMYVFTYYNGLKEIKVTTAVAILSLGAPITTLLSVMFNGTTMNADQGFGSLLILSGVLLMMYYAEFAQQLTVRTGATIHERN